MLFPASSGSPCKEAKISFDAQVHDNRTWMAAVHTDKLGSIIQAWTSSSNNNTDPTLGGAQTAKLAINCAKLNNFTSLLLQGDSKDAVPALQTGETTSNSAADDLLHLMHTLLRIGTSYMFLDTATSRPIILPNGHLSIILLVLSIYLCSLLGS